MLQATHSEIACRIWMISQAKLGYVFACAFMSPVESGNASEIHWEQMDIQWHPCIYTSTNTHCIDSNCHIVKKKNKNRARSKNGKAGSRRAPIAALDFHKNQIRFNYLLPYLSTYLTIYLSVYLFLYLSLSFFLSLCLSFFLSYFLSLFLSLSLSLSLPLSVSLSICQKK